MRISTSIVLATLSIAFSTAAFAAEPNTPHQPMMLSPVIVYSADTAAMDKMAKNQTEPVLRTGRSSSRNTMHDVPVHGDAGQSHHAE